MELPSMDKRTEPIDESYRGLPDISDEFFDYTVTGNQPVAVRESPLREVLEMGAKTVDKSGGFALPAECCDIISELNKEAAELGSGILGHRVGASNISELGVLVDFSGPGGAL